MSSIGGVSSPPPSYPAPAAAETSSTVKLADGASKTVTRDKQGDIVSATVDPSLLRLANGNMEVTLIVSVSR